MTARHQIRVGRLGRDRATPIDATPAPTVGEMLQVARERKGVDLFRAERDTKIRAKHLATLESGEYADLPGAVYTKGFLRNYALYLGLDPEDILLRWRDETTLAAGPRIAERTPVVAPPRPIAAPRRGLTFTRGLVVAGLVSIAIFAFLAYIVMQVARFAQSSPVGLDGPRVREVAAATESVVLSGTSAPAATIVITRTGSDARHDATADGQGKWRQEVPVAKGRNDFTIVARDPITNRDSDALSVIVTVPVPATPAPVASGTAPSASATALALTQPTEGSTSTDGSVIIAGTSDATSVSVTATRLGEPGTAAPSGSPPASAADTVTRTVPVPATKAFATDLSLAPGRWRIDVAGTAAGRSASTVSRTVDVAYSGVSVTVTASAEGRAWVQVTVDGDLAPGHRAGVTLDRNESRTFVGKRSVTVRTGNSGRTRFAVNGEDLGTLGRSGQVETWLFEKGKQPRRIG